MSPDPNWTINTVAISRSFKLYSLHLWSKTAFIGAKIFLSEKSRHSREKKLSWPVHLTTGQHAHSPHKQPLKEPLSCTACQAARDEKCQFFPFLPESPVTAPFPRACECLCMCVCVPHIKRSPRHAKNYGEKTPTFDGGATWKDWIT